MKKARLGKIKLLFTFSLVIFIMSALYLLQSNFSSKNILEIENENNKILEELRSLENEINLKDSENNKIKNQLNQSKEDFKKNYGFDYDLNKISAIDEEISLYEKENEEILLETKKLLTSYSPYYSGAYFEEDLYNNFLTIFNDIISEDPLEKVNPNLYEYLKIGEVAKLLSKSGTVKYLKSINGDLDNQKFNVMVSCLSINFQRLNNISQEGTKLKGNLDLIYKDVYSLLQNYNRIEKYGMNLGNLNIDALILLESKSKNFMEQYYKNLKIIESLKENKEGMEQ